MATVIHLYGTVGKDAATIIVLFVIAFVALWVRSAL